jgi:hypothetical protein
MRVSLVIDGDAKGAEQAAEAASRAIGDLGKGTDETSKAIEAAFNKAIGVTGKFGAANDNAAGSAVGFAQKLGDLTSKALGVDNALAKVATGTGGLAKSFNDLVRGGVGIAALPGAIGLAVSAATLFYSVANTGADTAAKRLDEQARLIGVVRDAYKGAAGDAGNFATQSKAVTEFLLQMNLAGLQADLQKAAKGIAAGFDRSNFFAGVNTWAAPNVQDDTLRNYDALRKAVDGLNASIASGSGDVKVYQEEIAAIGKAAFVTKPELAKLAAQFLVASQPAAALQNRAGENKDGIAVLRGEANDEQKKKFGIEQQATDYDRLTKSLQRQAAAQEAEALTVGKSAGEAAKLRAEYILGEAATQSNIKKTDEYAAAVDKLAGRFGAAAQKAAEANLKSNAAFDLSQLGRTSLDANVASQLRGAYGDDVASQLDGALATSIRFNESMKELKATAFDLGSGAFRDIRTEIEAGTSALDIMGKVGVNAFNKIIDKAGDKALDAMLSKLFGAFGGGGGSSGGLLKWLGFDEGGYTGPGGKHEPAGIVHKGEVVWSQDDVSRHGGVAVVEAMRRGVPGYAGGGEVGGAPSPLNYMARRNSIVPVNNAPQRTQVDINLFIDDEGKFGAIARDAGRAGGQEAADIRVRTFSRHEMPDRMQEIQRNPRNRG